MKQFFLLSLILSALTASAPALARSGELRDAIPKNKRHISSTPEASPCDADFNHVKEQAASELNEQEIDMAGHKLAATKDSFTSAEVWSTAANDAAVLSMSGEAKEVGTGRLYSLHARAVCSPSSNKFELMETEFHSK
ncbi:MAG: hypothetical protein ACXVA8_12895 [Bdellovibrionota bacterium]